jgi:glycosyltransferase involved in cell wall biosynthesis
MFIAPRRQSGAAGTSSGIDITPADRVRVLVVATEWFSAHGGLSTLNRHLCTGLAQVGADVICVVPSRSESERDHAAVMGVALIEVPSSPGCSVRHALMRPPALPTGWTPDVIIGHSRVTGSEAKILAEDHYRSAARLHLVHTAPDEIEWWRPDRMDDAGVRAEERTRIELALGRDATRVLTVGPRLHLLLQRDLSVFPGTPEPLRLDPGFDTADQARREPPPGGPIQLLLMGRLEDSEIKGVDLAARAIAHALDLRGQDAPEVELLVRGAPPGECAHLRDRILAWAACPALHVVARSFSTDAETLQHDFKRATLALLPSRAEGFGLVGVEAITAGTPVLISGRSGLGMLLQEILPPDQASRIVVPVRLDEREDVVRWGHQVAAVLRDRAAAFATADAVRRSANEQRTWAIAARQVLDVVQQARAGADRAAIQRRRR